MTTTDTRTVARKVWPTGPSTSEQSDVAHNPPWKRGIGDTLSPTSIDQRLTAEEPPLK
jgi:hypothetical protein